ncbi:hypothetical protein F5I97DRAFT_1937294 [Phlebopus sp. FC_14]|nr:hypothetical protein F5I97DRAFT_1937294 [Phlebopus sp. FC_14]
MAGCGRGPAESYGQKLPDQVDRITALFDAHLGLVTDVRDLYRDRVTLEREYAAKLAIIAKKALEKKNKAAVSLVLGDSPTKPYDDDTVRQNTLDHAYSQIIMSMSDAAQDHIRLADTLTNQVVEPLRMLERHHDDTKKKQTQYYQKLLGERDRLYQDRVKYDEDYAELEVYRQKQEHAQQQQDRHADRAVRQYEQQRIDVLTSKNVYLVSIAVANGTKAKFYNEDLPTLEDDLQTKLVNACARILLQAQTVQGAHQDALRDRLGSATVAIDGIRPDRDQNVFMDHNVRPFTIPHDWAFEPCAGHYDTDEMCVEPVAKVFLQNKLARSRHKVMELEPVLAVKRGELDKYAALVAEYSAGNTPGNVDDAVNSYLDAKQHLAFLSTSEMVLRVEMDTIVAALGDDEGGESPHSFKSSSFSIPTTCGYCKASIWGLSKSGKTCKACGLSVHAKCELKVPAECPGTGTRGEHALTKPSEMVVDTRKTNSSTPPRSETSSKSYLRMPRRIGRVSLSHTPARVLFDFVASSPFELDVSEGGTVHILEEDDGYGWVKVVNDREARGLVPASYLDIDTENVVASERKVGVGEVMSAREDRGSGQFGTSSPSLQMYVPTHTTSVRVIYDYTAQTPEELSIVEGETIELSSGPHGGENFAEGWWEGHDKDGRKGIFPSNYVYGAEWAFGLVWS